MKIFIPTLGRADQVTYRNLPPEIQSQVISITESGGIGKIRQQLLDRCRYTRETFVMLDDDLTFATRRLDDPTKFIPATAKAIEAMLREISINIDSYAHVGVAGREGGNRNVEDYVYNTRNLRVLAFNPELMPRECRFDRIPIMEDFDMALQLLERGLPSIQLNWIVHDQKMSNAPGGCSTYRTTELQTMAAMRLQQLHPLYVQVVKKKTKTAWGGQERTDVRIQWKRAYEYGKQAALLDARKGKDPDIERE